MNQELLKRQFEQKKLELENELLTINSSNYDIRLKLSAEFEKIEFSSLTLSDDEVSIINNAISLAKSNFEKKWSEYLSSFGIQF
jgi:hypothetical protein